jgi:hypothetical protein
VTPLRLAATLMWIAASAAAQEQMFRLGDGANLEQVEITYVAVAPPARPGGYGSIAVRVTNLDQRAHVVRLDVSEAYSDNRAYGARRTLSLAAGEVATTALPIAWTTSGLRLGASVDGRRDHDFHQVTSGRGFGAPTVEVPAVLVVADDGTFGESTADALHRHFNRGAAAASPTYGGVARSVAARRSAELSEDWTALSRYDVIVVDLPSAGLDAARQRGLADWVAAGGLLVGVRGDEALLPEGPLKTALAPALGPEGPASGAHGAGEWTVMRDRPDAATLAAAFRRPPGEQIPGQGRRFAGLPLDGWFARLEIPGLGAIPVRLFLLLIVAYLIVVGVKARRILRARRPARLLVFLPAAGFGFAGAILAYGVVSEGLGVKGAVRSFTLLDQRTRVASAFAARTLYAGLAPGRLDAGPRTLVASPDFVDALEDRAPHRLIFDLDHGRSLDGSALPARRPTTLVTASVDVARERLRFRRRDDGGLDVLAEPTFRPLPGAPMVVRDHSGAWYEGDAAGPLKKSDEKTARVALRRCLDGFAGVAVAAPWTEEQVDSWTRRGRRYSYLVHEVGERSPPEAPEEQQRVALWLAAMAERALRQGGYVAAVEAAPFLDGFGLDAAWRASSHLVAGVLAEDDFGR